MLQIRIPIIVEGKYDKARLAQVTDAPILTTEGFGIFNNAEKTALIRQLGKDGVILLCDSDGGGKVIRGYLKSILPPEKVYDLYVPQVAGKERRKRRASKAGFLGVEGMDNGVLTDLLARLAAAHPEILASPEIPASDREGDSGMPPPRAPITKTDLYLLGLTGGENAADRRDRLCRKLGFPAGMNAGALLTALNILYSRDQLASLCAEPEEAPS